MLGYLSLDIICSEKRTAEFRSLLGTDNVRGQISAYVFAPNGDYSFIIWLARRGGKMNQIARCDWLPERARWSHLASSGLPAVFHKKNIPESHMINPLLTKFVRSRWLDIGLIPFFASLWTSTLSQSMNTHKKRTWPISSHLELTLGQ